MIAWQVVEYESSNVQSGNVAFDETTDTTLTATLASSITADQSLLVFSHGVPNVNVQDPPSSSGFTGAITDSTTLTFSRSAVGTVTGTDTLTYYLVEFTDATTVQSRCV